MCQLGQSRMSTSGWVAFCVLVAVLVVSSPARAEDSEAPSWFEGELKVGVGVDYSRGDYDEAVDTEMVFVPFSLAYQLDSFALTPTPRDQLELKLVVPYVWLDGAITAGDKSTEQEDGIGDVHIGASYLYYPVEDRLPAVELSFLTKLPTADEDDGLGTGKTDYTLQLTLFQRYGDLVPFASGGYRFIGKNRPDFSLRDGATARVGTSWIVCQRVALGVSYDWRDAISKRTENNNLVRADDAHEITVFGTVQLGSGLRVAPYGVAGLADGSPDFAVGLQLSWTIPLRSRDGAR